MSGQSGNDQQVVIVVAEVVPFQTCYVRSNHFCMDPRNLCLDVDRCSIPNVLIRNDRIRFIIILHEYYYIWLPSSLYNTYVISYNNLQYILNKTPDELQEWWYSLDDEDQSYAMEIIIEYS